MPLQFDNRFVAELPGDPLDSRKPRQVRGAAWSPATPTPVAAPRLVAYSPEVAALVGFTEGEVREPWFAELLGGNTLLPGMAPYAAVYGGHQFGHWAGQLGDGRAITLGEAINAGGERWELQLKGAGPTPFSRTADGRAVLRSSVREFLCSEAMHHLGVPTTRALSLVATGEQVVRDMFYDGHPAPEAGAVVCRVAPSFIRFGNFEIFAARAEHAVLEQLVDFTIARDFPHIEGDAAGRRSAWLAEVGERTARMIVHWMRVGFVHGVMNTDNMSILGLTIDYGPYGWLDDFDPDWTPNTTDASGRRYRYAQQPAIAQWNLVRLAEAVAPLFGSEAPLHDAIARFGSTFTHEYDRMNAAKLGIPDMRGTVEAGDVALAREALMLLRQAEMDYTLFFRALGEIGDILPGDRAPSTLLGDVFYDDEARDAQAPALDAWIRRWHARVSREGDAAAARRARMHAVNPRYVLRNYLAQQAAERAEAGDPSMIHRLLDVVRRPYDDQPGHADLAVRRPGWARDRPGSSMLSCSS
jgi:uncharacterized protein YdiU (UPF0061 family)